MADYSCPKGHRSSEADFCSECGAKITGGGAPDHGAAASLSPCPDCKAPRAHDGGDFCEICGYNFSTGEHGDVAFAQIAGATSAAASMDSGAPVEEAVSPAPATKWSLVASIDPALREEGSPEPPATNGPVTFAVDKPESLIGRHSRARGIEPEVALDFDDAVSHRHAIVARLEDGSLTVRDIGSANGTRLNGRDLEPLTDAALKDGDELTLGHWTRLQVKAD
jgi:uncharacterized Zn finger protein (UPF0148 family)